LRLRIQGALEHDGIQGSMKLQTSRHLGIQAKGCVKKRRERLRVRFRRTEQWSTRKRQDETYQALEL
jgi:hypothetical protein